MGDAWEAASAETITERWDAFFKASQDRIRTLEDALRPLVQKLHIAVVVRDLLAPQGYASRCSTCGDRWPCKYETARKVLEER